MLFGEFKENSKKLIHLWIAIFFIRLIFFSISSIVKASSGDSDSNISWIWEHLTLSKGDSWGVAWLICNIGITALDFFFGFRVHRENRKLLSKSYSEEETIILNKMYRNLKYALVLIIIAIFMQMMHGFLWWLVGAASLAFKFFYYRELIHLDPRYMMFNFLLKKEDK